MTILQKIARLCPQRQTPGLDEETVTRFIANDPQLNEAIRAADQRLSEFSPAERELLSRPEAEQITELQHGFVNFYPQTVVNPYVGLAAQGPWIITTAGAVIYDAGGYGMLGFGHNPPRIAAALAHSQVMANIMTASFSQKKFTEALRQEIGKNAHFSPGKAPYSHFLCLNSGSEAMTLAARFVDLNAHTQLRGSSSHKIKILAIEGSFHGRTDRPAQFSHSSLPVYQKHLASFAHLTNLVVVRPNDLDHLHQVFAEARGQQNFFEAFYMEPVMGEGDPGMAINPEFYREARRLTREMGSLLVVDSIQAGLRAHGCLSIIDYPGMEGISPPDIEVFSKALNAGQFPLSVLAVNATTAALYVDGIYGNTMTSNPRGLELASAVLAQVSPALARNISEMGKVLLEEFKKLHREFPQLIKAVKGTGLLLSIQINPDYGSVSAAGGMEQQLRQAGLGVIHGGKNSLRFTPHFQINTAEVSLIVGKLRDLFQAAT